MGCSQQDNDEESVDSREEALMDMLGLSSLADVGDEVEENVSSLITKKCADANGLPPVETFLKPIHSQQTDVVTDDLLHQYETTGVCLIPPQLASLSIPAELLRRWTEELVWGGTQVQADKSYETIQIMRRGGTEANPDDIVIHSKKVLTRLEHFVDAHDGWSELCHQHLARLVSLIFGQEMVLYKEKLNLKPAGGSGFAPHLDSPSLRIALGPEGPQTFCTVMLAIDDMTEINGCLKVCKGPWTEEHCVNTIAPEENGNPDAGGRAGAIPLEEADNLEFEPLICKGGSIAVFNGWVPHRSAANRSPFPRRAVFLTYNPKAEGDFHTTYYDKMEEKRLRWRESVGLARREQQMEDEKRELEALSTIPKI